MNGRMQYLLLQPLVQKGYGHTPGDNVQEIGYLNESSHSLLDNDSKTQSEIKKYMCYMCLQVQQ